MRDVLNRRTVAIALAITGALVVGACSGSDDDETGNGGDAQTPTLSVLQPLDVVEDGSEYVWNPLRMGAGGFVTGVVLHPTTPNVRLARTDVGGVYGWDEGLGQWRQLLTGDGVPDAGEHPGDYQVESMALSPSDPEVIYVAGGSDFNPAEGEAPVGSGRVLRSGDGGRTWTAGEQRFFISGNQEYRQLGERLGVDPEDPDHVLLGTRREGLWESRDGGLTFTQVPTTAVPIGGIGEPTSDQPGIMFVSWDRETSGRVYAGASGAGVYRSDDGGASWRQIEDLGGSATVPAEGQIVGGRLVVAFNDGGDGRSASVRIYDPQNDEWADVTPSFEAPWWAVAVDPADPKRMAAVALQTNDGQLWRSTDGGANWTSAAVVDRTAQIPWIEQATQGTFAVVGRLVFDPLGSGELFWGDGAGLYRVADITSDPVVLTIDSIGIEELVAADIVAPEGADPVSAVADFQGFTHANENAFPSAMLIDDRFTGGTDIDYSGGNPRSLVWVGAEYNLYSSPDRESRGAYSDDGGATWTLLPNLTEDFFGGEVAVSATDPSNIVWLPGYFEKSDEHYWAPKGLYVTLDRGKTWTHLPFVVDSNDFHRLMWWLTRQALAADKVDGGVFALMSNDEKFYVSRDGGLTWEQAAHAPPCNEGNDCHVFGQLRARPDVAGEMWASAGADGLYRTRDLGASPWERISGIDEVRAYGFGAPLSDGGPPAVYVFGRGAGESERGLWRSGDEGATWTMIARYPFGLYADVNSVNGDADLPGRVYVGFGGNGFVYGDDPSLG